MGNQNQKSNNPILEKYIEMEKEEHELLGQIIVARSKETEQIYSVKEFRYASEHQYLSALRKMQRRKAFSNKKHAQQIIKLITLQSSVKDDVCGMTFFLHCVFERIDQNLAQLLLQRKHNGKPFSEEQILSFLRSICGGILFMHDNNLRNYFLTKTSIKVGQDGNFKLLDTSIVNDPSPYIKIYNGMPIHRGVYLSPELIEELLHKNNDPDVTAKSDIFTAGVLALQLCTLEEMDSYYNYNKLTLDLKGLRQRVNSIGYSLFLKQLLLEMLEAGEDDRVGLLSLKQKVSPTDNKSTTEFSHAQRSTTSQGIITKNNSFLPLKQQYTPFMQLNEPIYQPKIKPYEPEQPRKRMYSFQTFPAKISVSPVEIGHKRQGSDLKNKNIVNIGRVASKSFNRPSVSTNVEKNHQMHQQQEKKQQSFLPQPQTPINSLNSINLNKAKPSDFGILPVVNNNPVETPLKEGQAEMNLGSTPIRKVQLLQSKRESPEKYTSQQRITSDFFNMKNMYGKHHFSNGAVYEGEFDENKNFAGSGILYYPNGSICYSGTWKNNCFHGFGILYNEKTKSNYLETNFRNFALNNNDGWQRYEGEFKMDKKDGFGTLYFVNGDKFSGCFREDMVEGYGTFTSRKGEIVAGIWKNNILK